GLLTGNSLNHAASDCEISVLGKIYSFITCNLPVTLTSLSAFTVLHAKVDNKIMTKLNAKDASLTLRLNFIVNHFLSRESLLHYGKTGQPTIITKINFLLKNIWLKHTLIL